MQFNYFLFFFNIRSAAAPGTEPVGPDGQAPVVGGAKNPQQIAAQRRLQQTQAQVDEVCLNFTNEAPNNKKTL